jgi:drug/metabolite transporter (DMT)-like permease
MNTYWPTLIPILSALCAATAGILARKLLKGIPSKVFMPIAFSMMTATLLLFSPFFYRFTYSTLSMLLVLVIASIDTAANYFYFKTFEKSEASVAIPILSLSPVVTFILSGLLLGEKPKLTSIVGSILIMFLIIRLSSSKQDLKSFRATTLRPAVISSILFGASAIPSKYLLSTMKATNALTLYMLRGALITLFSVLVFKNSVRSFDVKTYRFIFLRSLFVIGQYLLLYTAFTLGSTGVAVTLGNITPVFVLILGGLFLKEKITIQKTCIVLLVLAISLIV